MGSPAYTKTWEHDANQLFATTGSAVDDYKTLLLGIKDSLVNAGTFTAEWVVRGSSDGSGGAVKNPGDASPDLWVGIADIVAANPGSNHSWIILEQAGINQNTPGGENQRACQLCIDVLGGGLNDPAYISVWLSPKGGFGAAPDGSGMDGTATDRPTASDEVFLLANGLWLGGSGAFTARLHVSISSTGTGTRLAIYIDNDLRALWIVDKPSSAISGWADPVIGGVAGVAAANNAGSYSIWWDGAAAKGYDATGPTTFAVHFGCLGAGGKAGGDLVRVANELQTAPADFAGLGIKLVSETVGARGLNHGDLDDIYWGAIGQESAGLPDDGTRKWVQMGHLWLPWLNDGTPFLTA